MRLSHLVRYFTVKRIGTIQQEPVTQGTVRRPCAHCLIGQLTQGSISKTPSR